MSFTEQLEVNFIISQFIDNKNASVTIEETNGWRQCDYPDLLLCRNCARVKSCKAQAKVY